MLQKLIIQNYALIDTVEISFSKQLNIITGETGAGKSIILGALSLILGQRQEQTSFFNPEKKCLVEGHFHIEPYALTSFFEENDLEYEALTIIRREITPDGRSRAFINDTPVNLAVLKSLTENLVAIHSQHAIIELNQQSFQLSVLDALAMQNHEVRAFGKKHRELQRKITQLAQLKAVAQQQFSEIDFLQFQFDELEQAKLIPNELEPLENELNALNHAEEILRNTHQVQQLIEESEYSSLTQLKTALPLLLAVEKYLPSISAITERLRSVQIELKDINEELLVINQEVEVNEERLVWVQERLNTIYHLLQKHRCKTVEELLEIQHQISDKLEKIQHSDDEIEQLNAEIHAENQILEGLAENIHTQRLQVIPELVQFVTQTLAKLGMPQTQFQVELVYSSTYNTLGKSEVNYWFSANAGQSLAKVSKVASGGELSRLMLSIKTLIAQKTALPTLIFDEIDTGISGEVALQMGHILEQLSTNLQVAAITHLPQIASKGQHHLFVYKSNATDTHTKTNLKLLNTEERIAAIAEMLSGKNPNEAAIANAKTLLNAH